MPSEFTLINRYFKRPHTHTVLGVGDDGAIVKAAPGREWVVSTDMLVAGTHFLANTDPENLGWKALAVNVSDMAAMAAEPHWALLAAAVPAADEPWIAAFANGFFACAETYGIDVIGGDTTRGPMTFCVTIFGDVPDGQALLRSNAQPGDEIWISGAPGLAALGLAHLQQRCVLNPTAQAACLMALHRPQPRVALGLALRGLAHSAIDVSDGVLADLGHILEQSKVAATVYLAHFPQTVYNTGIDRALATDCLLSGGDDYELLFTASAMRHTEITALSERLQLTLTCIGSIGHGKAGDIKLLDSAGKRIPFDKRGYDHFN